jgi:hypothetical protein
MPKVTFASPVLTKLLPVTRIDPHDALPSNLPDRGMTNPASACGLSKAAIASHLAARQNFPAQLTRASD